MRKPPLVKAQTALRKQNKKYGEKRFLIWRMEFLHPVKRGTIMTLISPGDCTLQCGVWLWEHDSEFTNWQHPAIWYVDLGWHAIEFAQTFRLPYLNVTSGFNFDHITAVDMSFCTNLRNFYLNRTTLGRTKMTLCRLSRWRILAILGFRGPIMGSLKSPCTTSSSVW